MIQHLVLSMMMQQLGYLETSLQWPSDSFASATSVNRKTTQRSAPRLESWPFEVLCFVMDTDGIATVSIKFSPRQCTSVSDSLSFDANPSTEDLNWIPVLEAPVAFSAYHVRHILVAAFSSYALWLTRNKCDSLNLP